jgi:hypothetical protein
LRVVVPFVEGMLHPRVLPAIERQGYVAVPVQLYEVIDYSVLVGELLASGSDFIIVEQDVETRSGFLHGFEECSEPWCFHAYRFAGSYEDAGLGNLVPLGCTRFRAEIGKPAGLERRHWLGFDRHLAEVLLGEGHKPHRHPGDCVHHHDYQR